MLIISIGTTELYSYTCTCRGAAAAVIVFDITSKDSFAKAKSWIKELQRQVGLCLFRPILQITFSCTPCFGSHLLLHWLHGEVHQDTVSSLLMSSASGLLAALLAHYDLHK